MKHLLLILVLAMLMIATSAEPQQPVPPPPSAPAGTESDRDEMRREIAQMRVLIDQMQRNLAQVASGETALKHQFDLDIQLWRMMVNRMEKQLGPDRAKQ
jgi:hypothetical protein